MTDADARQALFDSKLPAFTISERTGPSGTTWRALTCGRGDCRKTFVVAEDLPGPAAPCPHCWKAGRIEGAQRAAA